MLGKIVIEGDVPDNVDMVDPNTMNLVAEVSVYSVQTFNSSGHPRICVLDCGLKLNQLRCLVARGARVDVVPWNHPLDTCHYDGLFLSNGPGDPQTCGASVDQIRRVINTSPPDSPTPIFGICLGHQLLAVAAGCDTYKLKYVVPKIEFMYLFRDQYIYSTCQKSPIFCFAQLLMQILVNFQNQGQI